MNQFITSSMAIAKRVIKHAFTNPALLLPSIIFPLFFFAAFAGGLSNISRAPGFNYVAGYTAFQFVFVFIQSAAFGGVFTGFTMASDFENGFTRRLMLATADRRAIVVGYVLAALVRYSFTATLVIVVALIARMNVLGSTVDLVGLVMIALLINIIATLWGLGVALRFRTIQAGPVMQIPVFLVLFLAPVYVPLNLLVGWIHTVARFNPVTVVLQSGRSLLAGIPEQVGAAFLLLLLLMTIFSIWALRGLFKAEQIV